MRTHITLRLSDDVLQAVDEAAEQSGRTRAREIEWNLRMMLLPKVRTDVSLGDIGRLENALQGSGAKSRLGENIELPKEAVEIVNKAQRRVEDTADKFRLSPDGKACRHGFFRCDKGCWK